MPQKKREKSGTEKIYDRDWRNHSDYLQTLDYCQRNYQGLGLGQEGAKEYLAEIGLQRHEEVVSFGDDGDRPTFIASDLTGWELETDVIDPRRPVQKRKRKGSKGITGYGAKMVRSASHVMQRQYGRARLGFLTPTLPDHRRYHPIWVYRWSEIVRKFIQELQRELERKGAPTHIIGVTEPQPKRTEDLGYPIPHLHLVYVAWDGKTYMKGAKNKFGKRKKDNYISHAVMQRIFARILANEIMIVTGEEISVDELNPRVDTVGVRKSVEGYLGKYMSKGAKDVKKLLDQDPDRTDLPTHWWHCTKGLRRIVKGLVGGLSPALIRAIIEDPNGLIEAGIVRYVRRITKIINGIERIIGYAFRFSSAYNPTKLSDIQSAFSTS